MFHDSGMRLSEHGSCFDSCRKGWVQIFRRRLEETITCVKPIISYLWQGFWHFDQSAVLTSNGLFGTAGNWCKYDGTDNRQCCPCLRTWFLRLGKGIYSQPNCTVRARATVRMNWWSSVGLPMGPVVPVIFWWKIVKCGNLGIWSGKGKKRELRELKTHWDRIENLDHINRMDTFM